MATWQSLCRACATGIHEGGCCGCMACRVTPEPVAPLTRAEIEEAIRHTLETRRRKPDAQVAKYHAQINDLLEQWRTAVLEEAIADTSADCYQDIPAHRPPQSDAKSDHLGPRVTRGDEPTTE